MSNKAIFLDRDGVINFEKGYTTSLTDFKILPDVFDVLKKFQDCGYLLIVITNQGAISKKLFTKEDLEEIHKYLLSELEKHQIILTEIYYCVHHPDSDSGKCICRKPDSLLIEKALARFDIDPSQSYFIGDKESDMQAARNVGIRGVKIDKNSSLNLIVGQIIRG